MLFDPFEEQLYLPARLVDLGYGDSWQDEVVGEETEPLERLRVHIGYAAQNFG
jgi:hypothetical protein